MKHALLLGGSLSFLVTSCASVGPSLESVLGPAPQTASTGPLVATQEAAYAPQPVEVSWKERLGQGYLFAERQGDYRGLADVLARLGQVATSVPDFELTGSPFLLLYDDPGSVPTAELRARVCLPVERRLDDLGPGLGFDVLPTELVVYARLDERVNQALRAVPELMREIASLGGQPTGPVRAVLLPASDGARPRTEVQVPWARSVQ